MPIDKKRIVIYRSLPREEVSSAATLQGETLVHIGDVGRLMQFLGERLHLAAKMHDLDKVTERDEFFAYITRSRETTWREDHLKRSRHHLAVIDGVPEDVNLIDVMEYITDCIASGLSRKGEVYDVELSPAVLHLAFQNTVKLLLDNVEAR